jgi:N-acetyl-anhydromuramyl-L-alanine amidase AmpD
MTYEYIESPNKSSRKGHQVGGIIGHFTAWGEMNGTIRYMCNKIKAPTNLNRGVIVVNGVKYYNAKAAAHYMTGRTGRTVMLVPENEAAWHAGSRTTKPQLNGKGSLNLWTIGHEICNWGGLRKAGDKFFCWPNNWTYEYKGPAPVHCPKRYNIALTDDSYRLQDGRLAFEEGNIEYWEPYTEEAIKATIKLWGEIIDRYQISQEWIAGHEHVDPNRKIDPGPVFPWKRIVDELYPPQRPEVDTPDLLFTIPEGEPSESNLPAKQGGREEPDGFWSACCSLFKLLPENSDVLLCNWIIGVVVYGMNRNIMSF